MTEQRAETAPDEASAAGVLSSGKADNEVWHDLSRCESVISIRYSYYTACLLSSGASAASRARAAPSSVR